MLWNHPLSGFLILLRFETLAGNRLLQLDPAIDGVFKGPYPIGIDPVNIFLYFLLDGTFRKNKGYCRNVKPL